ncbi:MAG: hypothetical protein OXK74_01755 [Gemmatimonadota bacterium]|nr:hypothetical protein [Gemmatimonadota bacterium]
MVTFRTANGRVSATNIRDEGRGFEWTEAEELDGEGRIGLTGIARAGRARRRNPQRCEAPPCGGTTIRASVPASEPEHPGARGIQR